MKSLPVRTYTNGTIGTIAATAHVNLATDPRSLRPSRSIQINTTAIGCRMHRISSTGFFTQRTVPGTRAAQPARNRLLGILGGAHLSHLELVRSIRPGLG